MDKNNEFKENDLVDEAKKGKRLFIIAIICFLIAFGFILWAAIVQDKNVKNSDIIGIVGFLGFGVASVIIMIKAFPLILLYESDRVWNEYEQKELYKISYVNRNTLEEKLINKKFEPYNGYYKRKKFSFLKDSITYYFRFVDTKTVSGCAKREINAFKKIHKKERTSCLCLFVCLDGLTDRDLQDVKDIGKKYIVNENVLDPHLRENYIVVAVDKTTGEGYFMDIGKKHRISIYHHGCKMIKKIL